MGVSAKLIHRPILTSPTEKLQGVTHFGRYEYRSTCDGPKSSLPSAQAPSRKATIVTTGRTATIFIFGILFCQASAQAQLFGERNLGSPLTRKIRAKSETAGTGGVEAKFQRDQRSSAEFVGRDRRDTRSFVGNISGRTQGRVRTSVEGLREMPVRNLNQRRTRRRGRTSFYEPRLVVGFEHSRAPSEETFITVRSPKIQASLRKSLSGDIVVSVNSGNATLRGSVASERHRSLAAMMLEFEPGVETVINELQVNPAARPAPAAKSTQ